MLTFRAIVLWLHIAGVVVWVGGIFFMTAILLPALRKSASSAEEFAKSLEGLMQRFRSINWEAMGLIVLTGIFNLLNAGLIRNFHYSSLYLSLFFLKLGLIIVLVGNYMLTYYNYVPKLVSLSRDFGEAPLEKSELFGQLRKKITVLSVHNLFLASVVILLGLVLGHL